VHLPARLRALRIPARLTARALLPALALLLATGASAAPIPLLDIGAAGFVGQAQQGPFDQPVQVDSYAQFTATFGASSAGLANPYLAPSVAAFFVNGGQHLWIVRTSAATDASLIGVDGGPGARTGLQALADVEGIGAVAIPGATSQVVQTAMIVHCEAMGDRVAVLDPVSPTDPNAVITQRAGLASVDGYAALYFPHVIAAPAGVSQTLPPSGFVAGIYARNSPPDTPAGPTRGVVTTATGVSYAGDLSTLNPLGINAIRQITGQGVQLFGARTLASNDWLYVAVRRMGIALERSIHSGTEWALFEPNNETLWSQLRTDVGNFMFARYQEGWFPGTTPSQAYFVRCDVTTMTATDLLEGRTVILVGFAPVLPSEFIVLRIVHDRSSLAVSPATPTLSLRAPQPNPASGQTRFSFELPRTEAITLRVLDVAGRTVRTLAAGEELTVGRHDRVWDGRDDSGASTPAGLYVVQLQASGQSIIQRVARVR